MRTEWVDLHGNPVMLDNGPCLQTVMCDDCSHDRMRAPKEPEMSNVTIDPITTAIGSTIAVGPQLVNPNDRATVWDDGSRALLCDMHGKLIFHSLLPIDNDRMNELFAKILAGTLSNSEKLAIAILQGEESAIWAMLDAVQEDHGRPLPEFWWFDDPAAPKDAHTWSYCYLHGEAEKLCVKLFSDMNDIDSADCFVSDTPMPSKPGEYNAVLYGRRAVVVLVPGRFEQHYLQGRVVFADDAPALAYARNPSEWH